MNGDYQVVKARLNEVIVTQFAVCLILNYHHLAFLGDRYFATTLPSLCYDPVSLRKDKETRTWTETGSRKRRETTKTLIQTGLWRYLRGEDVQRRTWER